MCAKCVSEAGWMLGLLSGRLKPKYNTPRTVVAASIASAAARRGAAVAANVNVPYAGES